MGTFLSYFLVYWGITVLFYKYGVPERIALLSRTTKSRLLYELSECEFCMDHHVGIFPAAIFGLIFGYEWTLLAYPFMGASLANIVKTLK
jgi:hypothetical protein